MHHKANRHTSRRTALAAEAGRTLLESVTEAGGVLLDYYGKVLKPREKESSSSIVCEADLAAEERILRRIKKSFPCDNIIAEESGFQRGTSEYTWVIDPLDGTSNFVAGLPWFGVQIAVLQGASPIMAAMYLPLEPTLYMAKAGGGASRNGLRVKVTAERRLQNVLCAFGFDPGAEGKHLRQQADMLFRVASGVRNMRATNSLFDFCYTVDGRLGACVNLKTKIWDIVPASLILPEAGGKFTDLQGGKLDFGLTGDPCDRIYQVLGASRTLHPRVLSLARAGRKAA